MIPRRTLTFRTLRKILKTVFLLESLDQFQKHRFLSKICVTLLSEVARKRHKKMPIAYRLFNWKNLKSILQMRTQPKTTMNHRRVSFVTKSSNQNHV